MSKESSLKKIIEDYTGGIRHPIKDRGIFSFQNPNLIDYIICFSGKGGISLTTYVPGEGGSHLMINIRKDQKDIKCLESSGSGTYLNPRMRISKLLTFEKRKGESNADLMYRILTHAKRFRYRDDIQDPQKVGAIEFLTLNLRKPLQVLYYAKKD